VIFAVAMTSGFAEALIVTGAASLQYCFFFLPPPNSFKIRGAENWLALALFITTAIITSRLATARKEAERALRKAEARELISELRELTDDGLRQIRTMSYLLHPPVLEQEGLGAAVGSLVDGFVQRSGMRVDVDLPLGLGRLLEEIETASFRIIQEALTNVHRHSGSLTAQIRITRTTTELVLEVRDEGRGIAPDVFESSTGTIPRIGVGIAGMRERVRKLGGRLGIQSGSSGTTVRAVIPIPPPVA
jgi:signal transduction histidine kinase